MVTRRRQGGQASKHLVSRPARAGEKTPRTRASRACPCWRRLKRLSLPSLRSCGSMASSTSITPRSPDPSRTFACIPLTL
eukprot:762756-Hanusia_phi.AAC.3